MRWSFRLPGLLALVALLPGLAAAGAAAGPPRLPSPRSHLDLRARPPAPPRLLQPALPGMAMTEASEATAESIARAFVEDRLAPPGELALLSVVLGGGAVRFVTLEQRFEGRPVATGRITVAVDPEGRVLSARAGELAPSGPRTRSAKSRLATGDEAWRHATRLLPAAAKQGGRRVSTERAWLATATGVEPVWRVRALPTSDPLDARELLLRETDGRLLRSESAGFGAVRARVYPQDPSGPSELVDFPDPRTNPSIDSPAGWVELPFTGGNNVEAHLERDAVLSDSGYAPQASGDPPTFDFPFTGDPTTDTDAAITNVFWALNTAHDRFRELGFDEASGALQDEGFGRGGIDGDRLHALVQYSTYDGTEPYNAIASAIGADGAPSYIAVGVFELPSGELRDGAFETDLLIHEYGHAVSIRLFGGEPLCLGGAQPAALLEGWSDFFAASFTKDPVLGAWTSGDALNGQRSSPLDSNGLSVLNFCAQGCDAFRDGEIWAGALWDLREDLIGLHGEEVGIQKAEQLALEAMRYAPCRPTLLDARDALLLADAALNDGAHHCLAWSVFAGRGLGASASTSGPDDQLPEPGFDLPAQCSMGAELWFDHAEYGSSAEARVQLIDGSGAATGTGLTITTAAGDSELVPLSAMPGGPLFEAELPLVPGLPVPGDGLVQVSDGDTVSAEHLPTGAIASAQVSEEMQLFVLDHLITGSVCQAQGDDDHADAPDWGLPGFLDAGENADLVVRAASATRGPLVDTLVGVSSNHPGVTVLPAGPIDLGTIPAQDRGFSQIFSIPLHVSAAPTVSAGETATLTFTLQARGRSGVFTLDLPLNLDYVVESSISPFRFGVETFEPSSPTALQWTHEEKRPGGDDWRLTSCGRDGDSFSYGNVRTDCSTYSEDQEAALLLSPPLFAGLPADTIAWRFREFDWNVRVDLYTDPTVDFCDADMVGAFLTADADTLPYDDPTGIFNYGPLRAYWFVDNEPDWFASGTYGFGTGAQPVQPGLDQMRLAFIFWNEIFDVDDCGFETTNDGSFYLDDVRFTYDHVRVVPEATPCTADCTLHVEAAFFPAGGKCAGEPFELDASATELSGCAGRLLFTFEGPGVPAGFELTTETRAPAVGEDGGAWTVTASCDTQPDCRAVRVLSNAPPQAPGLGGPHPESLRLRRENDDLRLEWRGAAVPATYGVYRTSDRDELAAGVSTWPLALAIDGEGPRGEGEALLRAAALAPGLDYFRVTARDPCTNLPR